MASAELSGPGCQQEQWVWGGPVVPVDCISPDLAPYLCSDVMCEVVSGLSLSLTSDSAVLLKEEEMNSSEQPADPAKYITCVIRREPKKLTEAKL